MALNVSAGGSILAANMNTIVSDVNSMLTTYGLTADVAQVTAGSTFVLSSFLATLQSKLTTANNNAKNKTKADLSGIVNYGVGDSVLATLFNLIDAKAIEIKGTYCSCHCNYSPCSCNCNYSPCCDYSCTCNCNYSPCSCNCNYSPCSNCNCPCEISAAGSL